MSAALLGALLTLALFLRQREGWALFIHLSSICRLPGEMGLFPRQRA